MGTGEDGTCSFYLCLSFLIHKMEHLASVTAKAPRWSRPKHSSLAMRPQEMGWSQSEAVESHGSKTRRRLLRGWRGGVGDSKQ